MINKVAFTGRETMLTNKIAKPIEQQVVKASTYIEEAVAPKISKEVAEVPVYFSPYSKVEVPVQKPENLVNRTGLDFFA